MKTERHASVPAEEITPELLPIVEALDLVENCHQLASEGYTIVENAAGAEFVARLRKTIRKSVSEHDPCSGSLAGKRILAGDPVYAEAAMNPVVMAMAEFSVGRGFLLGSHIPSIHVGGRPALDLHSDEQMFPAPLPVHNMMLTACWVMDEFTEAGGATRVVPGSNKHLRHPTEDEIAASHGAIPMVCPVGSIVFWDGRVWHGNYARTLGGERVVLHATYYRLLMRPADDYSDIAEELVENYGPRMSQLLGLDDYMYEKSFDYANDYDTFEKTLINARS